jgi:hypothetical protein
VQGVKKATLLKALEYCEHHLKNPDPPVKEYEKYRSDNIGAWDLAFMSAVSMEMLFDLVLAANYLDIKGLLELGCKTIANMMRSMLTRRVKAVTVLTLSLR